MLDIPSSLPLIWADESQIEQVINNLLINAFKWSSRGSTVTVRAEDKDGQLLIQVFQDHGPGIPEKNQKNIFDPYYRIESDRQHFSGLGLGLALCKKIVESHGGHIRVESEEGKGSTFHVELPLVTINDKEKGESTQN